MEECPEAHTQDEHLNLSKSQLDGVSCWKQVVLWKEEVWVSVSSVWDITEKQEYLNIKFYHYVGLTWKSKDINQNKRWLPCHWTLIKYIPPCILRMQYLPIWWKSCINLSQQIKRRNCQKKKKREEWGSDLSLSMRYLCLHYPLHCELHKCSLRYLPHWDCAFQWLLQNQRRTFCIFHCPGFQFHFCTKRLWFLESRLFCIHI